MNPESINSKLYMNTNLEGVILKSRQQGIKFVAVFLADIAVSAQKKLLFIYLW